MVDSTLAACRMIGSSFYYSHSMQPGSVADWTVGFVRMQVPLRLAGLRGDLARFPSVDGPLIAKDTRRSGSCQR
jgi:hypothetical protein